MANAASRAAAHGASLHAICARHQVRRLFAVPGLDRQIPLARTMTPVPAAGSHQHSGGTRDDYPKPGHPAEQRELAVTRAGPQIRVRLPAGGWQVGFRAQHDGRTVIEVTGQDGSLAGLVGSSRLPILSVDAGWCGAAREPDGGRRWWALAIGHVPAGQDQPSVTFTRKLPGERRAAVRPDAVDGLWVTVDGLWVAAAAGRYTAVRCAVGPVTLTRRLRPVTARPAL